MGVRSDHDPLVEEGPDAVDAGALVVGGVLDPGRRDDPLVGHDVAQPGDGLNEQAPYEQAKGILAERHQLNPDTAFGRLRAHARSTSQSLVAVARAVVDGSLAIT